MSRSKTERRIKPEKLTLLAQRSDLARLSINGEVVIEARPPALRMGKAMVELPIASFLQATAMAEAELARLVLEAVGPAKSVADLFCGLGPFTLRLAERAKVSAFDSDRGGHRCADPGGAPYAGAEAGDGGGARPVPRAAGAGRTQGV